MNMMRNVLYFFNSVLKMFPVILTAVISDEILRNGPPNFLQKLFFMQFSLAICDNLSHSLIALFVWLNVIDYQIKEKKNILGLVVCFLTGSLIDIDHFFMAKSFMFEVYIYIYYISSSFNIPIFRFLFFIFVMSMMMWEKKARYNQARKSVLLFLLVYNIT